MAISLLCTNNEITEIYNRHFHTIYRVAFVYMKNAHDTQDVIQDLFLKLMKTPIVFNDDEHEKAWLIKVATNLCKDNLRRFWRKHENIDDYENLQANANFEIDETFKVIMDLDDKYKTVVYLYYYEEYNSAEIAEMLGKPPATIRYYLAQARKILKKKLVENPKIFGTSQRGLQSLASEAGQNEKYN